MRLGNAGWQLDIDELLDSVGAHTKAIFVNSPCNPTGWTASREQLAAILSFARRRGLWVIADEVYHRFFYGGDARAPSFWDVAEPDDRVLFVNTFSKNWAMTGWRIGWLAAPPALGPAIENLVQYSTSGVAAFMQRAAIAALDRGEGFIAEQVERARTGRDIVCAGLESTGRVRFARPDGAFYLFLAVDGEPDTRRLCMKLIDEAGVGAAPGDTFGKAGAGFIRLCFLRNASRLRQATARLAGWLNAG
jgi:aspartate/methionine/tyrosine aminotransferase